MFKIARRGPASVARSLFSPSTFPRYSTPAHTRDLQRYFSRVSPSILKAFRGGYEYQKRVAASRRCAATTAAAEAEAIEGEIEQENFSQTPPSDNQINEAVQHGSITKFQDLADRGMVCRTVVDTITNRMGLETLTQVQSLTISQSLKGKDILAQARTGTGKTLAFLIPLLQNIISVDPKLEKRSGFGRSGDSTDIRAIIVSPTRELAEQIAEEARKVVRDTGVIVQAAVGGSAKREGLRKIMNEGCHILVGTPGRLNDILSDPYSQVRAPNLSCFVLDEADRLLDIGFAPDIRRMQDHLPNRSEIDRQTLLYSATVPREVMQIVRQTMKPDFQFVRTVQEGEQQTHEKVPQKLVTVPGFENHLPALLELCKRELSPAAGATGGPARPFKAIIYFSATANVSLTAAALKNLRNPGRSVFHQSPLHPATIIEIHGRLTQHERTRAADSFRLADSGILLSSDVTARGMDFPNVTHVIQVGLPVSQEQYVHRIGRTGRGDKTGEGWILLTKLEAKEIRRKLPDMPLQPDNTLETAKVDMKKDAQLPEHAAKTLIQVGEAMKMVPRSLKTHAYTASMGLYSWIPDKQVLVDAFNDLAKYGWGMESPPMISQFVARKMNLTRVEGIRIGHEERKTDFADDSRDQGMRNYGGGRGSSGFDREGGGRRGGYGSSWEGSGGRGGYGSSREGSGGRGGYGSYQEGSRSRGGYGSSREGSGGRGGYGSSREGSGGRGGYGSYQEGGGRPSYGERSGGGFSDRGRGGGYGGNRRGGYGDRDWI